MPLNKETRTADVVIVGGGASGLAAAIELGMRAPALKVLVIEKMDEPGRKIRATGSGRCNISNKAAEGFGRIMQFFRETGLMTRTYENGLVYPYSESAADVVSLLVAKAKALGIRFACGEELMSVKYLPAALTADAAPGSSNVFTLESIIKDRDGMRSVVTHASFLILAMGGKAGPTYGTIGDGYRLARNLGHSVVAAAPALTGVECSEWESGQIPQGIVMAGTRTKGTVILCRRSADGSGRYDKLFEESGEIQFTKYGLSGICVFNMTRFMRFDRRAGESPADFLISLNLFPDGDIGAFLRERVSLALQGEKAGDILRTVLKENIASYVISAAAAASGDDHLADRQTANLSGKDIDSICRAVHSLEFHPSAIRGWNDAQVTMGGVSLEEIDPDTSESLLVNGLYITGELADRDFPCGGFNLSNAWLTGLCAADAIANAVSNNQEDN